MTQLTVNKSRSRQLGVKKHSKIECAWTISGEYGDGVWIQGHSNTSSYCVAIVDTRKLIRLAKKFNGVKMVSPLDQWVVEKQKLYVNGYRNTFLQPNRFELYMPVIELRVQSAPVLLFGKKLLGKREACVDFQDGRHRVRVAEHMGATCIPVEVCMGQHNKLLKLCGCDCCNETM